MLVVGIILLGVRATHQVNKAREAERRRWAKGCKTALLTIVNRHEAASWWDDYDYRYHNSPNSLDLEMNSGPKAVAPNLTIVNVAVSQAVYDRLKERNTVCIYYLPASPMTFLLEEEL
jgi:hypothetical protein